MDDLYFDSVKVDTFLAEEYIKKKNIDVKEPNRGTAWDFKKKTLVNIPVPFTESSVTDLNEKLRNLSKKLHENSELFCHMDYLMRKTDVDETRNCHLKIISQYLKLEEWNLNTSYNMSPLIIEESTPLCCLGHVATLFRNENKPIVVCVKSTAPVCHLFYELCLDVGLEISLHLINDRDRNRFLSIGLPALSINMGCTLAITEDADIDSAVDVFINSSVQVPWRIERIYVQESVYEQLMEVLETRCTRVASERCVDAFRTSRGRGVECGVGAGAGGGVPVRAYRGARDLLALLPSEGGSLSLWCSSAAAAHELALASPSDFVWIDHYAVFDGPPSASMPFYYNSLWLKNYYSYMPENVYTQLQELQRSWIALPIDKRKAIVLEVLEKAASDRTYDAPTIAKLAEDITNWIPTDLVDIAPGRITMVIERPSSYTDIVIVNTFKKMLPLLKSTILGNMIVKFKTNENLLASKLFDAGVPLTTSKMTSGMGSECTYQVKVDSVDA